jgi:hypothetical protein
MSGVGARDGILVQVYLNLTESDARKCSSQVDRPECIQCVLMTTGGMCEDVSACIRTGLLLFERNSATYVPFIRSAGKSVFTTVNTQEDHVPAEVASGVYGITAHTQYWGFPEYLHIRRAYMCPRARTGSKTVF